MEKYGQAKITREMDKLISSPWLRKKAANVSSESFESFLYVKVDRENQRHASFTRSLIRTCVNSSDIIIDDPDAINFHGILPLRDNMTESPLLKDRTTSQRNRALVAVVALGMLCYA